MKKPLGYKVNARRRRKADAHPAVKTAAAEWAVIGSGSPNRQTVMHAMMSTAGLMERVSHPAFGQSSVALLTKSAGEVGLGTLSTQAGAAMVDEALTGLDVEQDMEENEMSVAQKDYQGWKNYESWAVALWLDNDEGSQGTVYEMAQSAIADGEEQRLADEIKNYIEDQNPLEGQNSMFSDLLNSALENVDWRELAQHYISFVQENESQGGN